MQMTAALAADMDQGSEMFCIRHSDVKCVVSTRRYRGPAGLRIYFADSHPPWEERLNEHMYRLLRQSFPKMGWSESLEPKPSRRGNR